MLMIREELNMVNGGFSIGSAVDTPKFDLGARVTSKTNPDYGIGRVINMEYLDGWFYEVAMQTGMLVTKEDDLQPFIEGL